MSRFACNYFNIELIGGRLVPTNFFPDCCKSGSTTSGLSRSDCIIHQLCIHIPQTNKSAMFRNKIHLVLSLSMLLHLKLSVLQIGANKNLQINVKMKQLEVAVRPSAFLWDPYFNQCDLRPWPIWPLTLKFVTFIKIWRLKFKLFQRYEFLFLNMFFLHCGCFF